MDDRLPLATTPGALTPAWVTAALRAGGTLDEATAVTAVEAEAVGTGQVCDSYRLHLTADGPAPASVVAKLPAADPTSRATATALRCYELEVRFYQELQPTLPVRTPRPLHADIELPGADFTLLLEDLAPARQGDQLAGCPPDDAAAAVAELARLHAPRWGDPDLAAVTWLFRDPEASRSSLGGLLPSLHDGFRARYRDRLGEEVVEACDELFGNLDGHLRPRSGPVTIVHGDYRLDNLLFDGLGGDVPVVVLDWQTVSTGPAMADVAYFIGAGMDPEVRRANEEGLVGSYLDALAAAGVEGYGRDEAWEAYRRGTWGGLVMAVAASMLVERTERGDEMFLTMATRHARHALDLEAPALL